MKIDIDFKDLYTIVTRSTDVSLFTFESPIVDGSLVLITVKVKPPFNDFILDYMNLSFGVDRDGIIDDFEIIRHRNVSKVLSTVLYCALTYLEAHPGEVIAVDGADLRRAYYYYRILQRNQTYLSSHFNLFGIRYFIRLLRGKDKYDSLKIDLDEVISLPTAAHDIQFTKHKSISNLFIFYLKDLE